MAEAKLIDGKACGRPAQARRRGRRGADRQRRPQTRPGNGAGRRGSGEPGLRPQQGQARGRARHGELRSSPAESTTEAELLALIERLNADPAVHGILVQLPLPERIDTAQMLRRSTRARTSTASIPRMSAGWARRGASSACARARRAASDAAAGPRGLVRGRSRGVGRSNQVGRPMALELLIAGCTVTIATSSRRATCRRVVRSADILVVAVGRPELIPRRLDQAGCGGDRCRHQPRARTTEDAAWWATSASPRRCRWRGHITPVPGGVGPMTVASLMYNTLQEARKSAGLPFVAI